MQEVLDVYRYVFYVEQNAFSLHVNNNELNRFKNIKKILTSSKLKQCM